MGLKKTNVYAVAFIRCHTVQFPPTHTSVWGGEGLGSLKDIYDINIAAIYNYVLCKGMEEQWSPSSLCVVTRNSLFFVSVTDLAARPCFCAGWSLSVKPRGPSPYLRSDMDRYEARKKPCDSVFKKDRRHRQR